MIWLTLLLPLVGAILNGFVLRSRVPKPVTHVISVLAVVGAFAAALLTYISFLKGGGEPQIKFGFDWIEAGDFSAPFKLMIDQLSGLMLLIITGIGSLIHIYAGGYMEEEDHYWRFFAYLNLFVFMMLLLVLGDNLLVMFVGWEGVGLCSYLLIGYWYQDDANAAAGMKAFLVNRIGDIGFLIGVFLTFKVFGTVSFSELRELILGSKGLSSEQLEAIGYITLALFVGACGKSAQLPLYIWLPDAMAGPTPVSALIHAATMVTAGIFMMTRLSFLYYLAPSTQQIVAIVGASTALFAATIAVTQNDIKKVLAYSTVSQLGFMVLGCGLGAYDAGVFHLFTHACFKALLFMGAGSVIVAMHHKQDMLEMGGLRKYLPITHLVMLVGVLAIIGFPLTSGFFSKDEILWKAWIGGGPYIWATAQAAALCTAFYMVRLLMLTFYGENRSDDHTKDHLHETSPVMWSPLIILAILSAFAGFLNVPHVFPGLPHQIFSHYLSPVITMPEQARENWSLLLSQHSTSEELLIMAISIIGMFAAAGSAMLLYRNGPSNFTEKLSLRFSQIYKTLLNKYYVDELYEALFVKPLRDIAYFLWKIVDVLIIDGIVNGVGQSCALLAGVTSFKMSGSLHRHGMVIVIGLVCMLTALLF